MRSVALALVLTVGMAGCGNSDKGGTPPVTTPTSGAIKGVATLAGMTAGNAGIVVGVLGGGAAITDDAGNYVISNVAPGPATIQAQFSGYQSATESVMVTAGQVTMAPALNLMPQVTMPMGKVGGHVFLFDNANGNGSMVTLSQNGGSAMSAADGSYSLANVPPGTYDATFTHNGYVAQTVRNVVVGVAGTFTVADVTLRRNTTSVGGHVITWLGSSPDASMQLASIDNALEVVAESNGAATVIGKGSTANNGVFAPDNHHLYLSDSNNNTQMLWLTAADGTGLTLVTARWNGFARFSASGERLVFDVYNPQTNNSDLYTVPSVGGTPTLAVANHQNINWVSDGSVFFVDANAKTDANGTAIADMTILDGNAGTLTTVAAVSTNNRRWSLIASSTAPVYAVYMTSTGSKGTTSTGDLYLWKPGMASGLKLTGAAPLAIIDSNASVYNFSGQFQSKGMLYVMAQNFDSDQTSSLNVIDVGAGALRQLVGATQGGYPLNNTFSYGAAAFQKSSARYFTIDMHNTAGVYSYDLVLLDMRAGTVTMVQPAAANFYFANPGPGDSVFWYVRKVRGLRNLFDATHVVFGNSRDNATGTMNWVLYDGMSHKLNDPAAKLSTNLLTLFSDDWRVAVYSSFSGTTGLGIVNLPAPGTAGDGVAVPLATPFLPGFNFALSLDGSHVAFVAPDAASVSTLYSVATAASATAVTPVKLLAEPNAGRQFSWVGISAKGDVAFTGDQSNAAATANAWAATATATVALDANGLGTNRPRFFAIADGARSFVTNESGGNTLYQVDTAATPTVTPIANYASFSARINTSWSRFFYSTSKPALVWANSTATGSTDGTWNFASISTNNPWQVRNPSLTCFRSSTSAITAYDGGTGVVPLALGTGYGLRLSYDGSQLLVVDQDGAGVNHLVVTPQAAPARTVLVDGYPTTNTTGYPSSTNVYGVIYSPDLSVLYAASSVGAPAVFTLRAYQLASGTAGTLGTNVDPNTLGWLNTGNNLVFQTTADPQLATYTLYSAAHDGLTATVVSTDVLNWTSSLTKDNLAGQTLTSRSGSLFSALPGQAGVALSTGSVAPNPSNQVSFSNDESHVFGVDVGAGTNNFNNAFAATVGSAGVLIDTYVQGNSVIPDWTGKHALLVAQHPTDPGLVIDQVTLQ